jgi:N-terminal conserved domain of Nudc./CS domain
MSLPIPTTSGTNVSDPRTPGSNAAAYFADCEGPLLELAQRSQGDIRKLLTAFFSFLHRRTDFYCVHDTDEERAEPSGAPSRMGFGEGDAEKLLLASFRQFPLRRIPRNRPLVAESNVFSVPSSHVPENTPSVARATPPSAELNQIQYTEEGLQVPVGNGGSTDQYQWTQSLEECTILVGVAPGLRAKDLVVSLQPARISVRKKHVGSSSIENTDDARDNGVILEGELSQGIVPSESTWTLEGGVLQISLYKKVKTFWDSVLLGDAKIDATLVDSRRNVNTYDEVTQAQIRKIIFDQQQASKGLPTSDEISGVKPSIPPLPSGVEYIDQDILDSKMKDLGK